MSRELALIEKLGVEFEEKGGLLYPLVEDAISGACIKTKDIGKYGHLWINFMQEAYPERYRSLVRFGLLVEKAVAVNEEAYEVVVWYGGETAWRFGCRRCFCREVCVENAGKDASGRICDERSGEYISLSMKMFCLLFYAQIFIIKIN